MATIITPKRDVLPQAKQKKIYKQNIINDNKLCSLNVSLNAITNRTVDYNRCYFLQKLGKCYYFNCGTMCPSLSLNVDREGYYNFTVYPENIACVKPKNPIFISSKHPTYYTVFDFPNKGTCITIVENTIVMDVDDLVGYKMGFIDPGKGFAEPYYYYQDFDWHPEEKTLVYNVDWFYPDLGSQDFKQNVLKCTKDNHCIFPEYNGD